MLHREYMVFGIVRLLQALGAYGFRGLYERKPNFAESIPPAVRQLSGIFKTGIIARLFPELERITAALFQKYASSETISGRKTTLIIESFSFGKGIPETFIAEGGYMFDCRFLTDPFEVEELRNLTGKDRKVSDFFENKRDIQVMIENAFRILQGSLESSGIGRFDTLRVCFGCQSGRHRSVYCAEKLAEMLKGNRAAEVMIFHNEIR
jgi:RNase adaptor protein for sRNA GlmZ degradation